MFRSVKYSDIIAVFTLAWLRKEGNVPKKTVLYSCAINAGNY